MSTTATNGLARRRAEFPSAALGETLTYQELGRAEYLNAVAVPEEHTFLKADGKLYLTDMGVAIRDAEIVAAGVVDAEGRRRWTGGEIVNWPNRPGLWAELSALARAILDLSEVGPGALKSGDPPADPGGAAGPG